MASVLLPHLSVRFPTKPKRCVRDKKEACPETVLFAQARKTAFSLTRPKLLC